MTDIVSRVQELADLADAALPRVGEVTGLADVSESQLLVALSSLRARVDASISVVAADLERKSARELGAAGLARRAGVRSGVELVQKLTGVTRADAARAVRAGELLEAAEQVAPTSPVAAEGDGPAPGESIEGGTAGRFDPGPRSLDSLASLAGAWDAPIAVAIRNRWLTIDQGDALRRGLGAPPALTAPTADTTESTAAQPWREAALRLIDACWEAGLTPEDLRKHATQLRAALDREWALGNATRLRGQRSLKRMVRADGMVRYDLLVDPLTDAQIWTPLFRHLAPRLGGPRFLTPEEQARAAELEGDTRTNEQLMADTFTGFLAAGLAGSGVFGTYAPTVNIAVTAADLRDALKSEHSADAHHRGDHIGCPAPSADSHDSAGNCPGPPATTALGWLEGKPEPLAGSQILAALCTGDHLATLFDDTGQALDATKKERTFSSRQRTAMALRDGGCLIPGCTMPPAACEGHHINPWNQRPENRKTETRDGVLLCRFHHLNLHNQGGRIERTGNDYRLHWPGRQPTRLVPKHGVMAQLRHDHEGREGREDR